MLRRVIVTVAFAAVALVLTAVGAEAATVDVPQPVGLMPAAEAPPAPRPSPTGPALEVLGAVLLVGGGIVIARSWVSPAQAV